MFPTIKIGFFLIPSYIIDRILYLHEQRQVYHSANCFADIFGHIELDKNSNTPIFFIEMIN